MRHSGSRCLYPQIKSIQAGRFSLTKSDSKAYTIEWSIDLRSQPPDVVYLAMLSDEQKWITLCPRWQIHVVYFLAGILLDTEVNVSYVLQEPGIWSRISSQRRWKSTHSGHTKNSAISSLTSPRISWDADQYARETSLETTPLKGYCDTG